MARHNTRNLLIVLLLALAAPARAAESAAVATGHDQVSLVTATDGAVPGQTLLVGLRLVLAPGWHTYWSNPGDAGEAPSLAVAVSGAAAGKAGAIDWPTPERLPDGPLMSYGYTGEVLLPVAVPLGQAPPGGGDRLRVSARAQWLACASVCIPESGSFTLDLPRGAARPSAQAGLFARAYARQPLPSPFPATVSTGGLLRLSGAGLGPQAVRDAWFFPAAAGLIDQAAAQPVRIAPGRVTLALHPLKPFATGARLDGVVVLRDAAGDESTLALQAQVGAAVGTEARLAPASSLARLLLFALLGGLVLNLMPCVFPVLAIKALAVGRLSGGARTAARRSAAFYTGGVLVAFGALGGLMLGLRAAGSVAGWGFQFQSPVFVVGTGWLLFAVGLNLAGLFEVGTVAAGVGQGLVARGGHAGDFATGLLAVLVATPCTAPFMGAAIAGALAAPAAVGMAVFLAMGLGLALPFVAVALLPRLAAWLPRPGSWMVLLRQALAFPVFASCAWLAWVAALEGGAGAVLVLACGLVLLGLAGWLLGLSQRPAPRRSWVLQAAAAASVIGAVALLPGLSPARQGEGAADSGVLADGVQAFSEARLASLRAEGRPVFVDMTAAWCVTCLVNERLALQPSAVRRAFAAHRVATLRGDWTGRDPSITGFLRAHGHEGVPFYVFYPAGGEGRELPQILTAARVLQEISG